MQHCRTARRMVPNRHAVEGVEQPSLDMQGGHRDLDFVVALLWEIRLRTLFQQLSCAMFVGKNVLTRLCLELVEHAVPVLGVGGCVCCMCVAQGVVMAGQAVWLKTGPLP